jgi:ketosteroid isomerase-like protein
MASKNVEFVRSIYTAWERGDWSSVAWAHPQIEFAIADGPVAFSTTGIRGMAENWRSWLEAWEGFGMEAEEFCELDNERVLVLHRYSGRGKTSGLELGEVGSKAAILVHVRDGKVTRLVGYNDRDHALADLALDPEGD